jgi:hypothetical protein
VAVGHIDVVVVYKVDRLTRSLADFAKHRSSSCTPKNNRSQVFERSALVCGNGRPLRVWVSTIARLKLIRKTWVAHPACPNREHHLGQLLEQRLGLLQVERVEPFGEPVVDGREEIAGLVSFALIAPLPRHAHRGTQFPGLRLLLACD